MALYRKKTLTEAVPYASGMEDGWSLLWPSGQIFDMMQTRDAAQASFDRSFRDPETPHTGEAEPSIVPVIHTLEGLHAITEGDWIATGPKGERYPIKADIFAATYEPADIVVQSASDNIDAAACAIWGELCPGMVMGDDDRPHYENAARAALAARVAK